jgi:hypothetical protein
VTELNQSQQGSTGGSGGFKGWVLAECKAFLNDPVMYSFTKFVQAIFIGIGISFLTMAVKIVVDAVAAALPV